MVKFVNAEMNFKFILKTEIFIPAKQLIIKFLKIKFYHIVS